MKKFVLFAVMCLFLTINTADAKPPIHEIHKKPHFEKVRMEHKMPRKAPPPPQGYYNYSDYSDYTDESSTSVIVGSAIGSFLANLISD